MHYHKETRHSPHSAEQLFALVADIESYPLFLPWCAEAHVRDRIDDVLTADLVIAFKGFRERYRSRVILSPPTENQGIGSIVVELIEGPFSDLHNSWSFEPSPHGGTFITFEVFFSFRSRLLESLMGLVFDRAVKKMSECFESRANVVYGDP